MEGIRFYRSSVSLSVESGALSYSHDQIQQNRSDFDYLFSCVYNYFAESFVVCDQIFLPDDEDEPDLYNKMLSCVRLSENNNPVCFTADILHIYGRQMPEFEGNEISIASRLPEENGEFKLWNYNERCKEDIEAIIVNFDGIFWEIYAKNKMIENVLLKQHKSDSNLEIYRVDYEMDTKACPIRSQSELKKIN